ncbi:MAG TPA: SDR family oxidoreductase [Actinomycetota bacterium]|nr:SDR family oxidoreductase [Actinomycetota bacterium]
MSYDYNGRVAIVTGASSGIGRAIALDLAARGVTVVAAARRADLLEEVAQACRATAPASEAVVTDVGDRAAVEKLVAGVLERHGKIDLLINNAGIPMRVHASRLTSNQIERTMRINYLGAAYAIVAALPSMLARKEGHIVNIASVAGRVASPRESAYTASKFAMTGLSEVLASDLDGTGVKVHMVYPGPIKTEIWEKVEEPPAYRGKLYPPQIIADAVRSCIEHDHFERWAPRRIGLVMIARTLFPTQFIKGTARYDRRKSADS